VVYGYEDVYEYECACKVEDEGRFANEVIEGDDTIRERSVSLCSRIRL
jgi:hypothetical protein